MKRSLLLLLGCICSLSIFAQPSSLDKTLLWRISGKGLSKPSYLYGTMHLTDERLFNFSDSLLLAIEKAEGFAIEIDPDEMMTVVMEEMVNDYKKAKFLKDVVSQKAYKKYAPLLSKKIKKPEEDITVKDVLQEQNKWMADAYKKGTMPTFVDTWLYDIARKQGKWVGGIEDVQDQTGLMQDNFNEQDLEFLTADYSSYGKKFLTYMIDTYVSQDITAMESSFGESDPERKDILLMRRNIKMARRMDSLSAIRTMVFAVGAAHLAGDSGVINLLKNRGFTVQPVFSAKKIAGKAYKINAKPIAWQKITDTNGFYEVEMPGKASQLKMFGLLEMRMNIDLFNSSGYLTMALPSSVDLSNPDSVLLNLARKMMQNEKLKQGKTVTKNNLKGREYFSQGDDGFKRAQIFVSGQVVYVAMVIFTKDGLSSGPDATHFFESLVLHQTETKPAEWVSFNNLLPGLQGAAPVALESNPQMDQQIQEENWKSQAFTGIDMQTSAVYMLIAKNTTNDSYLPNDSLYLSMLRQNTSGKSDSMQIDTLQIEDGMFTLEQKGIYKNEGIRFHSKTYVKGNRSYTMVALVPHGEQTEGIAQKVISSFRMGTPPASEWGAQQGGNGHITSWAPNSFSLKDREKDSEATTLVYNVRDTNNSYVYSVIGLPFDSTTWYNNQEEYWEWRLAQFDTTEDSIVAKKDISDNGLNGYLLDVIKKSHPQKTNIYRLFNYGDTSFTVFTSVPTVEKNDANIRRFFTDLKFSTPAPASTVFTSKAQQFIGRLYSADSATHAQPYNNLTDANFSKNDIPLLHQALMEHYSWDTSYPFSAMVQTEIGSKLRSLEDSTLSDFIKSKYDNRNGRDDEEQTGLLEILLRDANTTNMRFVIDALKATNGDSKINERVLSRLDDSLELVKPILSEALALLNKKNMARNVMIVADRMLDSNLLNTADILPYEPAILAYAKSKLEEINAETDGYGWALASAANIAGRLKTPASMGLLKQMIGSKHISVKMEGVHGLLKADAPLPENVLLSIAGDKSYRGELWEALKNKKKEASFPKVFKTQQAMGEAEIYYLAADDADPTNIVFLATQKTTINSKPANVYFYKIVFAGDDKTTTAHLGAVAFPTDVKEISPIEYSANILWDDEYSTKSQQKQMKALVDEIKEMLKPEEAEN